MRLTASDSVTYFRPSQCELRVWLRHLGEADREPSAYDEVLCTLGEKHEKDYLATLGPCLDLSQFPQKERIQRTLEAIAKQVSVLHQPAGKRPIPLGSLGGCINYNEFWDTACTIGAPICAMAFSNGNTRD